ncbi:MAG TPA: prepilin-type N-terminal cleavage/methylation domain-containing protein [Phycisphaerae bacterium]|nr:prepilin-type N-terminal cleavage/methylation domain-containing protein [Phycisphaerae bacterium]HRY71032.1 prepilin-type N-terminal cleavage/methylation domain-containing protein [Phycisphaerae bacterium]HSA29356.1 prepilin-type N-terminal cleavage/methylation domain-containing protein [Phycisphaerae bacterium]
MPHLRRSRGFTLIEVLVVVAIIALLVSVLLPSLESARKQARMVVCQANLKSLTTAFLAYASETKGFLPGNSEDDNADWLGLSNRNRKTGGYPGRQPEDGTVFKHMGRNRAAYRCPDDNPHRDTSQTNDAYSYTTPVMMSGANTASVGQSHYRFGGAGASGNYSETDHTANMRVSPTFILVEEDYEWYLSGCNNSAWDNDDGLTDRHSRKRGNVGCADGHVEALSLPPRPHTEGKYFGSRDQCVKYRSKWVSGREWYDEFYRGSSKTGGKGAYRQIEKCPSAEDYGVKHRYN